MSRNMMSQSAQYIPMKLFLIVIATDLMTSLKTTTVLTTGTLISVPSHVKTLAIAALPAQTLNTSDAPKTTRVSASIQTFTAITILTVMMLKMKNMKTVRMNTLKNLLLRSLQP